MTEKLQARKREELLFRPYQEIRLFFFQVVENLCEQHNLLFYVCLQQDDIRHKLRGEKMMICMEKEEEASFCLVPRLQAALLCSPCR